MSPSNGNNISSGRSSSSSSWRRSVAFSVITLCLIQFWISFNLSTTTVDYVNAIVYKMDLPTDNIDDDIAAALNKSSIMDDFKFINLTTPLPLPTLVHYDPHFLGGYRNQHMRFVAFVNYAVQNSIPQILLPSVRWGVAQGKDKGRASAPFEYLFDVVYWNERCEGLGLPRLVRYDATVLEGYSRSSSMNATTTATSGMMNNTTATLTTIPCFNLSSNLYSGLNEQLLRHPNTNLRKVNTWDNIGKLDGYSHCRRGPHESGQQQQANANDDSSSGRFTHLIAHGGSRGAGKLWAAYNAMQQQRGKNEGTNQITTIHNNRSITIHPEHHPVEKAINTILRPSEAIRTAINSAIQLSTTTATTTTMMGSTVHNKDQRQQHQQPSPPKFLALHPRIKHDMLQHRCSKHMEQNLTRIFDHLRGFELVSSTPTTSHHHSPLNLLFIAVNTELVMTEPPLKYPPELSELAVENARVLNRTRIYGMFGSESRRGIPTFESGTQTAENVSLLFV